MRKFLSILITAAMVLSLVPFAAFADDSLGFKVEDDTAYIYTADELMALSEYFNSEYRKYMDSWDYDSGVSQYVPTYFDVEIMADIDLDGKNWMPMTFNYDSEDRHTFNGNGHTIDNMSIFFVDEDPYAVNDDIGFFSDVENADIKDLTVKGEIKVYRDDVFSNVGGFGGDVDSDTIITNCHAEVDITIETEAYNGIEIGGFIGDFDDAYIFNSTSVSDILVMLDIYSEDYTYDIGGFIGDLDDSVIAGCHAKNGEIDIYYYSGDKHWTYTKAGGFAGESDDSAIYSSSASVDIEIHDDDMGPCDSTNALGGLVGESEYLEIYNSFAAGELKSDCLMNDVGGLVGENEDGYLIIENCYSLIETKIIDKEGSSNNIGGIIGDHESDATYSLKNVWSGANNEDPDSDNINGDDIPLDESGDFDMAKLIGLLNTGVKQLNEDDIPYITVWSYDDEDDSYPGAASPILAASDPTPETPLLRVDGTAEYQWQVSDNLNAKFTMYDYDPEFTDITETEKGKFTIEYGQNAYPEYYFFYAQYKIDSELEAISFKWKETEPSSVYELNYRLFDIFNSEYLADKAGVLSGSAEWSTVTMTGLEPGEYALELYYDEISTASRSAAQGNTVELDISNDASWTDIPGENSAALVNENYTGKLVRCIATLTNGQKIISSPVFYDYEAIDHDTLDDYTETSKPNNEDTAAMVPLFFGTTVRVHDAANGTITPNGIPMIIGGMEMTFSFIPDEGYAVADVICNGESIGAVETLTIDGFSGYITLTAVFEAIEP